MRDPKLQKGWIVLPVQNVMEGSGQYASMLLYF